MTNSFKNKKALLIGNGVNLIDSEQSISWNELLRDISNNYGIDIDLDNVFKPFPLAFEEMLHQKSGINHFNDKIKNLKQLIRRCIEQQLKGKSGFNFFHNKLAKLDYDDILTTNYDYGLELSIEPNFLERKIEFAQNRQERKFSLKRNYHLPQNNLYIWHIHGELIDSRNLSSSSKFYHEESIMIGYEHYSSYLQLIQDNIRGKSGTQKVENQSLLVRLKNESKSPFWIDIFFTHNIDIIGLGLDFSENHLWWLINYRANEIRKENSNSKVKFNNRIRFFYPKINGAYQIDINHFSDLDELIIKKNSIQKAKAIAEVLKAFKVHPKPIECDSYKDFYNKLSNNHLLS
ncbi:MAG: SIR2 family protein [Flavobacteriaceae bacterium]|nr:SIR2 family protein [Flavobacteriaceae bacterium]